jgi:hypothetical protein
MQGHTIQRRKFLAGAAAGAALVALSDSAMAGPGDAEPGTAGKTEVQSDMKVDVLVVGGGTAGTIAAIQAARAGASTLLIERGTQLGGTITTGGVSFPGLFDAWGKQIIAGIGWELVKKATVLDGGKLPDFSRVPGRHWQNQVRVNQFVYALLAEEACVEAGVEIAYYESPHEAERTADGWLVESIGPGMRRRVRCRQIVDCTGGATVVGMVGLPRLREKQTQPGSLLFKLGGTAPIGRAGLDQLYVHGADSSTAATLTKANMDGRTSLLKKLRANKNKRLIHMQPETAHRESYRIKGETVITVEDYKSGRVFDDAICYAFYPVDLHTRSGVKPKPLARGTVPTVPLGALIPEGSRDIMVAGRCVSSDRLANSGLRVQASCMAMGQAAGATAALAVASKTTPSKVPLADVKELLVRHEAIVPGM